MVFDRYRHDIERWLEIEEQNLLQKVCKIIDTEGRLVGEYKTRVTIVPVGVAIPYGASKGRPKTGQAPSLFRSFTYDDDGNQIASLPEIREWTQACEDAAQGANPDPVDPIDAPLGAVLVNSHCIPGAGINNLAIGSETLLQSHTIPADEIHYIRNIRGSGEAIGQFILYIDSNPVEIKRSGWHNWNVDFDYRTANGGKCLTEGQVIELKVINCGCDVADFDSTFIVVRKAV